MRDLIRDAVGVLSRADLPLKVKKNMLMTVLRIPTDETACVPVKQLRGHTERRIMNSLLPWLTRYKTLVVRTAWVPDRLSSPWMIVHTTDELARAVRDVRELSLKERELAYMLVHSDLADPDDPADRRNYVSGRFMIHPAHEAPREISLEVIDGEYHPAVFDKNDFDFNRSDRTARFYKYIGRPIWVPDKTTHAITAYEMRRLFSAIVSLEPQYRMLREAIAAAFGADLHTVVMVFDFVWSRKAADTFLVYDFDFVPSRRARRQPSSGGRPHPLGA